MQEIKEKTLIDTAVFTTKYVIEDKKTIVLVTHDIEDGAWQFFSDDSFVNFEEVAKVVGFQELINMDNSLLQILDMPLGYSATRKDEFDNWKIVKDND
jgi:hypothetical protein